MFCSYNSYRRSTDIMNTVLHRTSKDAIKTRTVADFVEGYGNDISDHIKELAVEILEENHFNTTMLTPHNEESLPKSIKRSVTQADGQEKLVKEQAVRDIVKGINSGRETREQINRPELISEVEYSESGCCYISIDDIGVKHQKDMRKDGGSKTGKYIENTVIHVQVDGRCYHLTTIGMQNAFAVLMAFLLKNHLMENRRLVFLADGAKDILNHIEAHFTFCAHSVILDWYHLKKKCKELISSSVNGKKEEKQLIIQSLLRMLWVGNVGEAISYLGSFDDKMVKSAYWLGELTGYLDRKRSQIVCYALREKLGLRISSNRVEKDNDMLVAERQKHNGMSWSGKGSGALAA
ncbi:MAG: hypothetical protein LBL49_05640, partial [Clostridiales Family XIII bacterium]|nr:hypothetical protein [Clostridiales Family XIII bacterium]